MNNLFVVVVLTSVTLSFSTQAMDNPLVQNTPGPLQTAVQLSPPRCWRMIPEKIKQKTDLKNWSDGQLKYGTLGTYSSGMGASVVAGCTLAAGSNIAIPICCCLGSIVCTYCSIQLHDERRRRDGNARFFCFSCPQ